MSLSVAALRELVSFGLTAEQILRVAEAQESSPVRSASAERQRRYRNRKAQSVTCDVTGDATCDVTAGEPLSPTPPIPNTPFTPLKGGVSPASQDQSLGEPKNNKRKPSRSIPENFPTTDLIARQQDAAREAGADCDMAYQAERFRSWALSKDARYSDWSQAWLNWTRTTIREAPRLKVVPMEARAVDQSEIWRGRVQRYRTGSRYWNTNDWGNPPGEPGCKAPPEIIAEFEWELTA